MNDEERAELQTMWETLCFEPVKLGSDVVCTLPKNHVSLVIRDGVPTLEGNHVCTFDVVDRFLELRRMSLRDQDV